MKTRIKHIAKHILTLTVALGLMHTALAQTTFNVSTVAQLSAAVNSAQNGDIINVAGGTYDLSNIGSGTGGVYWNFSTFRLQAGVTVVGSSNAPLTVFTLSSGASNGCFFEVLGGNGTTLIKNITMTRSGTGLGGTSGGGIRANGANVNLVVDNCYFSSKAGAGGGAMQITGGATVTVNNSSFHECGGQYGAAFSVSGNGTKLYINNSKMFNNTTAQNGGVFHISDFAFVEVRHSEIYDNAVNGEGGAAFLTGNSTLEIYNSTIVRNRSGRGGSGFYLNGFNRLVLSNCTMVGNINSGGWAAGGVSANDPCEIIIDNSIITGNISGDNNDDLPTNVANIENSVVGGDLIVSNDPQADCQPNCIFEGVINPDEVVDIGDNGQVTITLPPTIVGPDGETISNPLADENGNPTVGSDPVQLAISLQLTATQQFICVGDTAYLSLQLNNVNGTTWFYLYRIGDNETLIPIADTNFNITQSPNRITFKLELQTATINRYIARAFGAANQNNLLATSNEVHIVIIPELPSTPINHSKNTTDE